MTRSRLTIAILALLLLGLAGTAALNAGIPPPVRPAPAVIASPAALSPAELRYYQEVAPILRAAAGEAGALAQLGAERSRNLLAIRAGQARLEAHLQTLDGLLEASAGPERFSSAAAAYQPAAAAVRKAMAAAEAAFLRFDWERVGVATERMADGAGQLETAAAALDRATTEEPAANVSPAATPNGHARGRRRLAGDPGAGFGVFLSEVALVRCRVCPVPRPACFRCGRDVSGTLLKFISASSILHFR
ncbi:MAG: hypothetical protein M3464_15045 [Chloroflexota bacterium]|nr:hypothetical protein [Chloroflexota bacterium]